MSQRTGFTLLELLVYVGILGITSSLMVGILSTLVRVQNQSSSTIEVSNQSQFLLQTIQRKVRDSSVFLVKVTTSTSPLDDDASPAKGSVIRLRMANPAEGIVSIYLASGTVWMSQKNETTDVETVDALTNSRVIVTTSSPTTPRFTKNSNPPGHDILAVNFTMAYNTNNPQLAVSREFQSSISRVAAAVFDAGVFPSTGSLNLGSATYPWNDIIVNGKIGVKNTSPTYDVDVTGGLRVTATSTFSSYLGVGTTTPAVLVHLFRTANDALTALFVENGSTSSSAIAQVAVGEDAVTKAFSMRYIASSTNADLANTSSTGVLHAFVGAMNGINFIAGGSNASIRFGTGGQATSNLRMIIDSSGRVGIGTSTPASGFHVVTATSTFGSNAGNTTGQVQLIANADNSPVSGRLTFGTDGSGWNFRIGKNQGGTLTDYIVITDAGAVGIGWTPAGPTLHVAGNMGGMGAGTWIGAGCEATCTGAYATIYADGTMTATDGGGSINTMRWDGTNLGIGNSSPTYYYKLDVVQNAVSGWAGGFQGPLTGNGGAEIMAGLTSGSAAVCSPACVLISWEDGDHSQIGTVSYSNNVVSYNAFTGSHIAEYRGDVDELDPGDLLVLTGKYSPWHAESPMGEPIYEVALSDKVNDKAVFGIYSGEVGDETGGTPRDAILVYSLGNAFMKVTDTNGSIETGDWITTSPRPRFGQRQEGDVRKGYTVAKAQVSVNWSEVETDPKLGFKWKQIPVSLHAQ